MTDKITPDKNVFLMRDFNPDICQLRHDVIDKEFESLRVESDRKHEEMKELFKSIRKDIKRDTNNSYNNLRDKIILTDKSLGDKVDSLCEFDDTLKGNGSPGVWESIRWVKWKIRIIFGIIVFIVILILGGNFKGVSLDTIREKLSGYTADTKQVESEIELEKVEGPDKKMGAMEDGKSFYVSPEEKVPE